MRSIADLVDDFLNGERLAGVLLPREQVTALAIAAVRFYAGWAVLAVHQKEKTNESTGLREWTTEEFDPLGDIGESTELTASEWGIIRPLFLLYCERENAIYLEASRGMGVEPYGRSVSEIQSEIQQTETDLPQKAFCYPCITV